MWGAEPTCYFNCQARFRCSMVRCVHEPFESLIHSHIYTQTQMETCNAWDFPHNEDQENCVAALGKH